MVVDAVVTVVVLIWAIVVFAPPVAAILNVPTGENPLGAQAAILIGWPADSVTGMISLATVGLIEPPPPVAEPEADDELTDDDPSHLEK